MMMMSMAIVALALAFCGTAAWADEQVSDAEGKSIQSALKNWGCQGGDMEKESGGSSVFEVDDAKCKDGEHDFKLDKNFKVIVITRH